MAYFNAPDPIQSTFFIPGSNTPGTGVQVFFYQAGTAIKQTVFKDNAGGASWTNPIVLDSGGNLPSGGQVWFLGGQTFKVVYAPATDTDPPTSPYRTLDNMAGVNDTSAGSGTSSAISAEWVAAATTPAFVNSSTMSLPGDQTSAGIADPGRRIKATVTAGTVYGFIQSRSFASGSTQINAIMDAAQVLDSGLSAVSYGFLSATNPSVPVGITHGKELTISAAGTTNIYAAQSENVQIVGSTTISQFDVGVAGQVRYMRSSSGGFSMLHSATSIILPTQTTLPINAGDSWIARSLGNTGTVIQAYQKGTGNSILTITPLTVVITGPTSGTYTPTSSARYLVVEVVGPGGGGATSPPAGFASSPGTQGNNSNFGPIQCQGGIGGATTYSAAVLVSSAASGGNVNIPGAGGIYCGAHGVGNTPGQSGAASYYGQGGVGGSWTPFSNALPGSVPGSGGGAVGATSAAQPSGFSGGAGAFSIGIFANVSGTTFPYAIGNPGTGGSGAGAPNGGNGANGQIIVREHFS